MNIEIKNNKVISLDIGKETFYLKDVDVSDIAELQKHVTYFEKHIQDESAGLPWTEEEIKRFIDESTDQQKNMFEILSKDPNGFDSSHLIKELKLKAPQAIAGIRAGLTRRAKRDFKNKGEIIESEWMKDKWMNEYWIHEDYFDIVKDYFKNKQ